MARTGWVVAAACAATLVAGTANAGVWHTGARGGVNLASIRGEFAKISDPEWQVAPTVGGFMEADVTRFASVVLEVSYVQKGATFVGNETDDTGTVIGTFDSHLVLDYVEVPALVRVWLPSSGRVGPYLTAGPTFGFALDGTVNSDAGSDQDVGDDLQFLDIGATVGLGMRVGTGVGRLDVEARYGTGFTDLWDISNNLESINQGFSLTLALSR